MVLCSHPLLHGEDFRHIDAVHENIVSWPKHPIKSENSVIPGLDPIAEQFENVVTSDDVVKTKIIRVQRPVTS